MKALVVDDSELARRVLGRMMLMLGHAEPIEAEDGFRALEVLAGAAEGDFDIVFVDLNMPRLGGVDLIKRMQQDERLKRIPVLVVSAEATPDRAVEAIKAGAMGYLTKPYHVDALRRQLEAIVSAGSVDDLEQSREL